MIKQHAVKTTLTALAIGITLGLAGCGGSNDAGGMGGMDHSASPMSQMPSTSPSSTDASPSASMAAQFNDADVMFVQGMIPHHEQAVDMSDTLLKESGITADTTALAKQIQAAQQPEITTMESWLETWGKPADGGMDHGGMGGMATDAEMKAFEQAEGSAAEKMYLEMMTKHHQGAIMMAQMEQKSGENPDAIRLAENIATSQKAELTTMKKLLAAL
jgi:uncharacterized protein (DUF305 family)